MYNKKEWPSKLWDCVLTLDSGLTSDVSEGHTDQANFTNFTMFTIFSITYFIMILWILKGNQSLAEDILSWTFCSFHLQIIILNNTGVWKVVKSCRGNRCAPVSSEWSLTQKGVSPNGDKLSINWNRTEVGEERKSHHRLPWDLA